MELILANAGQTRRETFDGRRYIVAPLTLIVPGVLKGSMGPLFYPADEVAKEPGIWNAMPMVLGHPQEDGKYVSARQPHVLEKLQVGTVYADRFEGGKRVAEGWFDEDKTRRVSPELYRRLTEQKPVELSTGLRTRNEPVANGTHHEGVEYTHVARDYRPDHLAILLDQKGACSVKDGCGVLNAGSVGAMRQAVFPAMGRFAKVLNECSMPMGDVPAEKIKKKKKRKATGAEEMPAMNAFGRLGAVLANCGGPGSGVPGPCPSLKDVAKVAAKAAKKSMKGTGNDPQVVIDMTHEAKGLAKEAKSSGGAGTTLKSAAEAFRKIAGIHKAQGEKKAAKASNKAAKLFKALHEEKQLGGTVNRLATVLANCQTTGKPGPCETATSGRSPVDVMDQLRRQIAPPPPVKKPKKVKLPSKKELRKLTDAQEARRNPKLLFARDRA